MSNYSRMLRFLVEYSEIQNENRAHAEIKLNVTLKIENTYFQEYIFHRNLGFFYNLINSLMIKDMTILLKTLNKNNFVLNGKMQ